MSVDPILKKEQLAFEAQLNELLKEHEGQVAIFKDGRAVEFFPEHGAAYARALDLFGIDGKFLIVAIKKSEPEPRTVSVAWEAGVMFENA